jgi:hypothetical protein
VSGGFIENPTGDDYAAAAERALADKRFALALEQIGAALSFDPLSPAYLALLRSIVTRAPKPLSMLPQEGEQFFGVIAVRAEALASRRRLGDAIETLLQVVTFRPGLPYLAWLDRWSAKGPLRGVRADEVLRRSLKLAAAFEREAPHPANVRGALALLDRLAEERITVRDSAVVIGAQLLRAAGGFDAAERRLRDALATGAGVVVHEAIAALLRADARLDEAIAEIDNAGAKAPARLEARVEKLEMLCELEKIADARVLAAHLEPDAHKSFGQVEVAIRACRAFAEARSGYRFEANRAELSTIARAADAPPIADRLLDRLDAYRTAVPALVGSVADVVRRALQRAAHERPLGPLRLRLRSDDPIPRSAAIALSSGLTELGLSGGIDGIEADAPVKMPNEASIHRVSALATSATDLDEWVRGEALEREELEAILVAPPAPRCGRNPVDRLHLVHVAAFALFARRADDDPEVALTLERYARGEDSWLAAAAIGVIGALLRREPAPHSATLLACVGDLRGEHVDAIHDPRALALAATPCPSPRARL